MPSSQPTTLWICGCHFCSTGEQAARKHGDACPGGPAELFVKTPVGRGVEETLEAARLIFGTENVRVGTLLHERSDMWHARPAFSDEGSPCVVVSVLVRRATPNPPTEDSDAE